MPNVFDKLQLKDRKVMLVLNAPPTFEQQLAQLQGVEVKRSLADVAEVEFALAFVTTPSELDAAVKGITSRATGDAVVWFAYPKASSKKYTSTINRDTGWDSLGAAGFEGVRMIAIDEDWSAVRFRRAEFIKTMKRDPKNALSAIGKKKTTGRKA
jgi:hypothetical protein